MMTEEEKEEEGEGGEEGLLLPLVQSQQSKSSLRYLNEFIRLKSAPLLLEMQMFPDAKEITEAMGIFHAVRRFLLPLIQRQQPTTCKNNILVVNKRAEENGRDNKNNCHNNNKKDENDDGDYSNSRNRNNQKNNNDHNHTHEKNDNDNDDDDDDDDDDNRSSNNKPLRKCVICVGDGCTPRSAALFALMWKDWEAIAIDPMMRGDDGDNGDDDDMVDCMMNLEKIQRGRRSKVVDCTSRWSKIDRLKAIRARIQDVCIRCEEAIIVLLHAHVTLEDCMAAIDAKTIIWGLVTCPCCHFVANHTTLWGRQPDIRYVDESIASPHCEVRLWNNQGKQQTMDNVVTVHLGNDWKRQIARPQQQPQVGSGGRGDGGGRQTNARKKKAPETSNRQQKRLYTRPTDAQLEMVQHEINTVTNPSHEDFERIATKIGISVVQCIQLFHKHQRKRTTKKIFTNTDYPPEWRRFAIDVLQQPSPTALDASVVSEIVSEHVMDFQAGQVAMNFVVDPQVLKQKGRQKKKKEATKDSSSSSVETSSSSHRYDVSPNCQLFGDDAALGMLVCGVVLDVRQCANTCFFTLSDMEQPSPGILQTCISPDFIESNDDVINNNNNNNNNNNSNNNSCSYNKGYSMPLVQLVRCWRNAIKVGDSIQMCGAPARTRSTKGNKDNGNPVFLCWNLWLLGDAETKGRSDV